MSLSNDVINTGSTPTRRGVNTPRVRGIKVQRVREVLWDRYTQRVELDLYKLVVWNKHSLYSSLILSSR